MFEKCSKIERSCGFCTISNYNPTISKYDDIKKEFCGVAGVGFVLVDQHEDPTEQ